MGQFHQADYKWTTPRLPYTQRYSSSYTPPKSFSKLQNYPILTFELYSLSEGQGVLFSMWSGYLQKCGCFKAWKSKTMQVQLIQSVHVNWWDSSTWLTTIGPLPGYLLPKDIPPVHLWSHSQSFKTTLTSHFSHKLYSLSEGYQVLFSMWSGYFTESWLL